MKLSINKRLIRPLKSLFFFLVFLFISNFSNAQLIYIDIIPDTTIFLNGGYYNLDLNDDRIKDFKITLYTSGDYSEVNLKFLHDSCYASCYSLEICVYTKAYSVNDSIGYSSPWSIYPNIKIASYGGMSVCMHDGAFIGQINKYLGLKLIKNGITYFGWVSIDIAPHSTYFKMKDYAYNNARLYSGSTISNVNESLIRKSKFDIFDFSSEIIVKSTNNLQIINAKIYNQNSQEMSNVFKNNEIKLDKNKYKEGMYFIVIKTNEGVNTLKIIVNK